MNACRPTAWITAVVVSLAAITSAHADVIKVAHADNQAHPKHQAFVRFAEIVKEKSDGRLEVQVYPSGQLGDERELIESLQTGAVHITSVSNGVMSAFAQQFMLLDIPFSFSGAGTARTVIDASQALLFENLDDIGLHGLAIWEQGFRQVSSSEKGIATAADVKGMKLRTMEAPLHVDAWRAMGANPTPMSWGQVYSSLQTGIIDGQENPLYVVTQEKLFEVQKHVSLTNHIYDAMPVIASGDWFSSLSTADADLIAAAMTEATAYQRGLVEAEVEKARTELEGLGVKVTETSAGEIAALKEMAQPAVIARVRTTLGDEPVDAWLKSISE
jgi:tripartite ATP-independent transporter DctP family solute receptor